MSISWLLAAIVIVAFWAAPIVAALALFPAGSRTHRQSRTGHD